MAFFDLIRIVLTLVGGTLIVVLARKARTRDSGGVRRRIFLLVIAAFSSLSYTRFLQLHEYGRFGRHAYHYHEIFHYYLGAKYYPELGYQRLYDCSFHALEESRARGVSVPFLEEVRSLEFRNASRQRAEQIEYSAKVCPALFTPARWKAFSQDIETLLSFGYEASWWKVMLFDLGFNPPPSWAAVAYPLANAIPLSQTSAEFLPMLDIVGVAVAAFLLYQFAGVLAGSAFLIVFGNNWLAEWIWTGGSFFRQEWFVALAIGIACLLGRRFRSAGMLFGFAAAMRVFPAGFALGALLSLAARGRRGQEAWGVATRFFGGCCLGFAIPALLSLALFRDGLWIEFFRNIVQHNRTLFVMHIGFDKLAVFGPEIGNQNFWWGAGLQRFAEWQEWMAARYEKHWLIFRTLKAVGVAMGLYVACTTGPVVAACLFGWTLLFFCNVPANYYYVFLALVPVAFLAEERSDRRAPWRVAAMFTAVLVFLVLPNLFRDHIVLNGWLNWVIALTLVGLLASYWSVSGIRRKLQTLRNR